MLFGAGDWHQRTEDRPPPPLLAVGARLRFGDALDADGDAQVGVAVAAAGDACASTPTATRLWAALYRGGRPVQYAYLAHELPLWAVQTVYAARPWAARDAVGRAAAVVGAPAGAAAQGVRWASLTHAAGLSATGDPALDAALPLPERYDIPAATVRAVAATRARGGRVVAVGTTVVRALEGAAAAGGGTLRAGRG